MPLPSSIHTAFLGQKIASERWHCRLGHPTNSVVQLALDKFGISRSFSSAPHMCQPYLKGKFTKLPFVLAKSKSRIPFETIHSNV